MIKTTELKVISVQDFDQLVEDTYGRPYSFQQQDDCKSRGMEYITVPTEDPYDYDNDTVPEVINGEEMGVSFKAWLERDPNQQLNSTDEWDRSYGLKMWYERNFYPNVDMIINDLHEKGLLDAGKYAIDIDW